MNIFAIICSIDAICCENANVRCHSVEFFLPSATARVSCKRISPIIENSWGQRMAQEECVEPESSRVSGKSVTWARWKFRVHGNGEVATSCTLQRAHRSLNAIEFSKILFFEIFRVHEWLLQSFLFVSFKASEMFTFYVRPPRLSDASLNLTVVGCWQSFQSICNATWKIIAKWFLS